MSILLKIMNEKSNSILLSSKESTVALLPFQILFVFRVQPVDSDIHRFYKPKKVCRVIRFVESIPGR